MLESDKELLDMIITKSISIIDNCIVFVDNDNLLVRVNSNSNLSLTNKFKNFVNKFKEHLLNETYVKNYIESRKQQ